MQILGEIFFTHSLSKLSTIFKIKSEIMFGDMQEKQEALRKTLGEMRLEAEAGDGLVKVTVNANREIINISVKPEAMTPDDPEQLEDLLLVAVNRAMATAAETEATESQKLIQDMLPPGMGGLADMFS